ncbi:MAG: Flp pilus assembly protein CpaB [Candidatus Omnitrophota bacterium]|nr:MAG: Flp pilus assembly protein CpaB [Candidatus Omnitrophota bacterium]
MDKRMINILIGLGFGILAFFMIHRYITEQQRELARLRAEGLLVRVAVARADIARESTITEDLVRMEEVNKNTLQPGDLTDLSSVIGKFAEVDILRGQHINSNMVRPLGVWKHLSQAVPQGMRAITIPVDKISAIEGLIKPQDKVDIIGVFVFPAEGGRSAPPVVITLFQGVQILATNRNISPYRISKEADTITLALKPEDVKVLTYTLELGRIRLVLRAPLDMSQIPYAALTFEELLKRLDLYLPPPQAEAELTVDVYRGSEREEAPIGYR